MQLILLGLFLGSSARLYAKKPVVTVASTTQLQCADSTIRGDVVINEILNSGGDVDPFIELRVKDENVSVKDWWLCAGKSGNCYSLIDGQWQVNVTTTPVTSSDSSFDDPTWLSHALSGSDLSGTYGEFVLLDGPLASGKVIDYFVFDKQNGSASCGINTVSGDIWEVSTNCGSCYDNHQSQNEDLGRQPDGSGGWGDRNKKLSTKGWNNDETSPPTVSASLLITAAEGASTCTPHVVSVSAIDADGNLITDYSGALTFTTDTEHGNWSFGSGDLPRGTLIPSADNDDGRVQYQFVPTDLGTAQFLLSNQHADQLTITVTDDDSGNTDSADVTFSNNAFVITDVDSFYDGSPANEHDMVIAGRDHAYKVELWTRGTGACAIATNYNSSAQNLKAWLTRDSQDPGGTGPKIVGVNTSSILGSSAPASDNVSLNFAAGVANFNLETTDVGKYIINLRDDSEVFANNIIIDGASSMQTVRPFGLAFSAIKKGGGANPQGDETTSNDPASTAFVAAGEPFSLTLGAYRYHSDDDSDNDGFPDTNANIADNLITASFALPTPVIDEFTPAGGAKGILAGNLSGHSGQFSATDVSYNEVGSVKLVAGVTGYLSTSDVNISANSGTIGRFSPDHFALVPGSSTNNACIAGATAFTYMGQDKVSLTYSLEAKNAAGGLTANYDDNNLGYLNTADIVYHAENDNQGIDLGARLVPSAVANWSGGKYEVAMTDVALSRTVAPDGPYQSLQLGLNLIDELDNRPLNGVDFRPDRENENADNCADVAFDDCSAISLGQPLDLRYGRTVLRNAFGPENSPLLMPLEVQYFDGTNFVLNSDDQCTSYLVGDVSLSNPSPVTLSSSADSISLSAGSGGTILATPNQLGSVDAQLAVPIWLQFNWDSTTNYDQDPTATAIFGRFHGNDRIINWREVRN